MTPAETYLEYLALTRHFTSEYDYFKYGGKVTVRRATFDARPDRWLFEKLSRKQNARWMIIASCLAGKKWIGDMVTEEAEELAAKRMRNVQSLSYVVGSDLDNVPYSFDYGIVVQQPGALPEFVHRTLAGEMQLETLAAIVGLTGCDGYWVGQNDPILTKVATMAGKYCPFMEMDKEKIRKIVVDRCSRAAV
jgi:hypothetical protein